MSALLLLHVSDPLVDCGGVSQPHRIPQVPHARGNLRAMRGDARPDMRQGDYSAIDTSGDVLGDAVTAATGRFAARPEPGRARVGFVGPAGAFLSCGSAIHVMSDIGKSMASMKVTLSPARRREAQMVMALIHRMSG